MWRESWFIENVEQLWWTNRFEAMVVVMTSFILAVSLSSSVYRWQRPNRNSEESTNLLPFETNDWSKEDSPLKEEDSQQEERPAVVVDTTPLTDDDESWQLQKLEFLERCRNNYGYASSPAGFIDTWRARELPGLIVPMAAWPRRRRLAEIKSSSSVTTPPPTAAAAAPSSQADAVVTESEREVYLDNAGAALPTRSLCEDILTTTTRTILANPHSTGGPAASRTQSLIEQAKQRILDHFDANPGRRLSHVPAAASSHGTMMMDKNTDDLVDCHPGYELVFTSGATESLRIVAEHFPWSSSSTCSCHGSLSPCSSVLVYPHNSHTSVVGMRHVALQRGAKFVCHPLSTLVHNMTTGNIAAVLRDATNKNDEPTDNDHGCAECRSRGAKNLLVLPLECNFGGDRFDAEAAIAQWRKSQRQSHGKKEPQTWYTLLDLAKAASTSPIHLARLDPDFAVVSFYKLFGEPTGLGCLLVKRTAVNLFAQTTRANRTPHWKDSDEPNPMPRRNYFGGGSVDAVAASMDFAVPRSDPTPLAALAQGTCHFRGIVSLLAGFREWDRLGGIDAIHRHVGCLAQEFVSRLKRLRHGNGRSVVIIYGGWKSYSSSTPSERPGPCIAFNVLRADGTFVGYNEVSKLAALNQPPIQLRTGCFCNPGACQFALGWADEEIISNYTKHGHVCGDQIDMVNGRPTGAIRVSFGKDSTWEDMDAFLSFLDQMFVAPLSTVHPGDQVVQCMKLPTEAVVDELYVFPIKSCAAQRVAKWQLDCSSGRLRFDREFALVDSSGCAMRLQTFPKMALLRPEIDPCASTMKVEAPNQATLFVELQGHSNDGSSVIKVCGGKCPGMIWGDQSVSDWFSNFLNTRCWLARYSLEEFCVSAYPSRRTPRDPRIAFANDHPLLVISRRAVDILNNVLSRRGNGTVLSRQFRPNIVVGTLGSNNMTEPSTSIEDRWSRLHFSDQNTTLESAGSCARCSMVDINSESGKKSCILRALAGYRRSNGQITFGVFFRASSQVLHNPNWIEIREGDPLLCE